MSVAAPAAHAKWLENLYLELHSPDTDSAEDGAGEAGLGIISGRVLTLSGHPVEGIEVLATLREYFRNTGSATSGGAKTAYTKTNADGFYAFRDLPPGIYMVGTAAAGIYAPGRVEARTGVKYADLLLKPQRYAEVRGVVTDPMGTAIGGVRIMPLVKGIPAGTVSNADGEFKLAVAVTGDAGAFPVRFQAPGYRETRYQIAKSDWVGGGDMLITVVMEQVYESGMVAGSINDSDGLPVGGEIVRLYSPSLKRNYHTLADGGGEYEFDGVEIADDYQLWVRPTGPYRDYLQANIAITAGYVRRDIKLDNLERGYRLSGRLLDPDGRPLPNLTLTVYSKSATAQTLAVTSDASGEFVVEDVPEGELVFESRSMPYYSLTGLHLNGSDSDKRVELVVNRGKHKLLGKVVGSDGRPLSAPKISITASQMVNGMQSRSSSSTSADADGRFVFTNLSTGQHTVTVNAPGYEGVRLQPVVGSERELVIKLERKTT